MTVTTRPKALPKHPPPSGSILVPGVLCNVTIPGTPHTCLRPNDTSHPRTKARHRKKQREDAYLATINVVNAARLGRDMAAFPAGKRLRINVTVGWENGRQRHDDTGVRGALKGLEDGFAQAIGVDDVWFDWNAVTQVRDSEGRGWVRICAEVQE